MVVHVDARQRGGSRFFGTPEFGCRVWLVLHARQGLIHLPCQRHNSSPPHHQPPRATEIVSATWLLQSLTMSSSDTKKQPDMPGVKRDYNGAEKMKKERGSEVDAKTSPFMPMFEKFRDELDEHHDRRERIIKASRDITAASKKM